VEIDQAINTSKEDQRKASKTLEHKYEAHQDINQVKPEQKDMKICILESTRVIRWSEYAAMKKM
jgi:hypothetical protein